MSKRRTRTDGGRRRRELHVEPLECRRLLNGDAHLLIDLQGPSGGMPTDVQNLVNVNGVVYFSGVLPGVGRELLRYEGPSLGVQLVANVVPGATSSNPSQLTNVGGVLYFTADDGLDPGNPYHTGNVVWRYDPATSNLVKLQEFASTTFETNFPKQLTGVGSTLFFVARRFDDQENNTLWRSDGTAAGTIRLRQVAMNEPKYLTAFDGRLFFQGTGNGSIDAPLGPELWVSDGTFVGTRVFKDLDTENAAPKFLTVVGPTLYFSANSEHPVSGSRDDVELWATDGSESGTYRVKDINPNPPLSDNEYSSHPKQLANVNNTLFFTAINSVTGNNGTLWKSGGGAATTVQVKPGLTDVRTITDVNGTAFFFASDGVNGAELWKSDGTDAGTVMVKDIVAPGGSSFPYQLTNVNGTLYFTVWTPDNAGRELWRSDGTEAGTFRVKNIRPGLDSSYPGYFANVSGTLFFSADDGVHGRELWKSDGTEGGTLPVARSSGTSNPLYLTPVGGVTFFVTQTPSGTMLWKTDGTTAGTVSVHNFGAPVLPRLLTDAGGSLLFFVSETSPSSNVFQLWRSDGTTLGTLPVATLGGNLFELEAVGSTVFFRNQGLAGNELWKSDGTAAGTVQVKNINPTGSSYPLNLSNVGGTLYFSADDGASGVELWRSDGSDAGTFRVKDINPGPGHSYLRGITNVNGTLFFSAVDPTNGRELWKSNGTEAGTVLVKNLQPGSAPGTFGSTPGPLGLVNFNGTLYFSGNDGTNGYELWKSDGTAAGTVMVVDQTPGGSTFPTELTPAGGRLYYRRPEFGFELILGLYVSDGTAAGTSTLLSDVQVSNLTNVGGSLYFKTGLPTTTGGTLGELWRSEGTAASTFLVKDINAGPNPSNPRYLVNSSGQLLFVARDPQFGEEIWAVDRFLPGDYDANGLVDGGDILKWQRELGTAVAPVGMSSDGNRSAAVDGGDLDVLTNHFGQLAPPPAVQSALTADFAAAVASGAASHRAAVDAVFADGDLTQAFVPTRGYRPRRRGA